MIHQGLCEHKYWLDYPRCDLVKIDLAPLSTEDKISLRSGNVVHKRCGSYSEYYHPLQYDRIEE
jgi:hypothetical protein